MKTDPLQSQSILDAKARLAAGRQSIHAQHAGGSPGIQVCARLTELVDSIVLELFQSALQQFPADRQKQLGERVALVAHSGYGRRALAPFSDVDLMILHEHGADADVSQLAGALLRDVFDTGLDLAQTVRTSSQACNLAAKDATIYTSLVESRFLAGSEKLFESYFDRFRSQARSRFKSLFEAVDQARREERQQYGETVYLLEPNVKRSRGGLREIQFLRWIGFAKFGAAEPDTLQLQGHLSKDDVQALRAAQEYLLRLRNEMHFFSGKPSDVLNRGEQVRLAEWYGFQQIDGLLPVEQFMREYFRHTGAARTVVAAFVAAARPGPAWQKVLGTVFSRQVEGDFLVGPRHIAATRKGLEKLSTDLGEVLRLTDLANLHNKRIAPQTWESVRGIVPRLNGEVSLATRSRFLSLLSQPARLGELLRQLLELGVLESILPAFKHARCLLQFNEYHKYTVDEHCILAVEKATEFLHDTGPLGRVYRSLKHKRTLHLALLIHDLGKGFVEDHSEVGLGIAADCAARLHLSARETEALKFLVHKHLVMAHLAFRRDTSDDRLIVRFAVEVGSPELLDMLFVLTAADLCAVGPGVWNDWKGEVLADLHERALRHLAGEGAVPESGDRQLKRQQAVRAALGADAHTDWFARQLEALPHAYLFGSPADRIADELRQLQSIQPGEVRATGRYLPERRTIEYVVSAHEEIVPGIFHRLTGALAGEGLQILSAQINTLADGLVLDRFYVLDPDYEGEPPPERMDSVNERLRAALLSPSAKRPTFRDLWSPTARKAPGDIGRLPTRMNSDNNTSDRFTIIDVFAHDRMGLLYDITRTLFEQGLSVSLAKIGTYLDQVVDVFYVTDQSGGKIVDDERLHAICAAVLEAVEGARRE